MREDEDFDVDFDDEDDLVDEDLTYEVLWAGTEVFGGTDVDAVEQSNPTLWTLTEQLLVAVLGSWKETVLAPPHWSFWTMLPPALQGEVCEQVEPSSMV